MMKSLAYLGNSSVLNSVTLLMKLLLEISARIIFQSYSWPFYRIIHKTALMVVLTYKGGLGRFLIMVSFSLEIEDTDFWAASRAGRAASNSISTTYCFSVACALLISNSAFNTILSF